MFCQLAGDRALSVRWRRRVLPVTDYEQGHSRGEDTGTRNGSGLVPAIKACALTRRVLLDRPAIDAVGPHSRPDMTW